MIYMFLNITIVFKKIMKNAKKKVQKKCTRVFLQALDNFRMNHLEIKNNDYIPNNVNNYYITYTSHIFPKIII